MKEIDDIVELLTGTAVIDKLTELIRSNDVEFALEENEYQKAVKAMKNMLPENRVNSYIKACETKIVAHILYAAYEGFRLNLANFRSPVSFRTIQMDFSDCVHGYLAESFPKSIEAEKIKDKFLKKLPQKCKKAEEKISSYFTLLDVYGLYVV